MNIVVLNKLPNKSDYPEEAFKLLFKVEDKHFWFWGRNRIIHAVVDKFYKKSEEKVLFEIGCGTGVVSSFLEKKGYGVEGIDMHYAGLKYARRRMSGTLYCGDVFKAKLSREYSAIGLFDVLEHIKDDAGFLKKCLKVLNTDGYVFITVPANMGLWSTMDEISGHKRRYSLKTVKSLLTKSGLKPVYLTHYNSIIFFPQFFFRKIFFSQKSIKKNNIRVLGEGLTVPPSIINNLLKAVMFFESKLIPYFSLPFGAAIIIVARKK